MSDETPIVLDPAADTDDERRLDHPEELTDVDALAGLAVWEAVDDTDEHSHGLDEFGIPGITAAPTPSRDRALRRARIIRNCLLRHGVPEVSIELQEGRPAPGADSWNACHPVALISHHIASRPTRRNPTPGLALVKRGRGDLPGPLANGYGGMDLVYRIITLGLANHPGTGGPWTVRGPLGTYTIPKDVARPYAWGTEYEGGFDDATWDQRYTNARTGASMTFREFMGRVNAGLAEAIWLINHHGRTPAPGMDLSGYHGEHKTWAPDRKVDRLHYTTGSGRGEIRTYDNQEDDDVSAKDVWEYPVPILPTGSGETRKARVVLAQAHKRAIDARTLAQAAYDQAKANAAAIAALAEHLDGAAAASIRATLDVPEPQVDPADDADRGDIPEPSPEPSPEPGA